MRQTSCDNCSRTAEFGSNHDIKRSYFDDGEVELTGYLCGQCRKPIVESFPAGRVELTIPDWVPADPASWTVPNSPDVVLDGVKSMQDLAAERLAKAERPAP